MVLKKWLLYYQVENIARYNHSVNFGSHNIGKYKSKVAG